MGGTHDNASPQQLLTVGLCIPTIPGRRDGRSQFRQVFRRPTLRALHQDDTKVMLRNRHHHHFARILKHIDLAIIYINHPCKTSRIKAKFLHGFQRA